MNPYKVSGFLTTVTLLRHFFSKSRDGIFSVSTDISVSAFNKKYIEGFRTCIFLWREKGPLNSRKKIQKRRTAIFAPAGIWKCSYLKMKPNIADHFLVYFFQLPLKINIILNIVPLSFEKVVKKFRHTILRLECLPANTFCSTEMLVNEHRLTTSVMCLL